MKSKKRIVIANWKMEVTTILDAQLIVRSTEGLIERIGDVEVIVCPSFVHIVPVMNASNGTIKIGAQNSSEMPRGAYTGESSPVALADAGISHVILGHSEVRAKGETDELVNAKIRALLRMGLTPIVCIGEKDRSTSAYEEDLKEQATKVFKSFSLDELARMIIAYEPIWAIGAHAKRECEPSECRDAIEIITKTITTMHSRDASMFLTYVYGGSVHPENTQLYLDVPGISGVLVGHASIDFKKFVEIIKITSQEVR